MSGRGRPALSQDKDDPTVQVPILMTASERASLDAFLAGLPTDLRLPRAEWIRRAIRAGIAAGATFR